MTNPPHMDINIQTRCGLVAKNFKRTAFPALYHTASRPPTAPSAPPPPLQVQEKEDSIFFVRVGVYGPKKHLGARGQ
jgi:hypothetical protein